MISISQKGDTILEVLLAITVVSACLGAAFVATNKNLIASRQSEERGQAVKIAEGQLERLKSVGQASTSQIYSSATNLFCIDNNNLIVNISAPPAPHPLACRNSSLGVSYDLTIEKAATDNNLFTIYNRWDKLGGNDKEQVRIIYRVYPQQ